MPFSSASKRKSKEDTTSIEGLREIALYYTVDDGREIALHEGVLKTNHLGGRFDAQFRARRYQLQLKEQSLSDDIREMRRGKDIYVYINPKDGFDGCVVLFTLFGSKEVAINWVAERQREYSIAKQP